MHCAECGAESAGVARLCVQCGAPLAGHGSVTADPASVAGVDGPGPAASAVTVVSPARQAAPESYVAGRGDKVPVQIRRVRRGYSRMGWAAVFGGWALFMVAGYFSEAGTPRDGFIAGLGLWVLAAIWFGQRIRLSAFLRRASDPCSATVAACQRGRRALLLDAPVDGYPSGLEVRLAWWAETGMLLPGESVILYGPLDGAGRLLVSSPGRGTAFVGIGRRRPAPPAGEEARQDDPHQPAAWQARRRFLRWGPLVLASLSFVAAVAATTLVAVPQLTGHLTEGQLRAGDCLTGSNLGLGTGGTWPYWVRAVPCTDQHLAEVIFSGNSWPRSMAYPGWDTVGNEGYGICGSAFIRYDGADPSMSAFVIFYIIPDKATWSSGDRQLVCLAYQSGPVDYSIKGSKR